MWTPDTLTMCDNVHVPLTPVQFIVYPGCIENEKITAVYCSVIYANVRQCQNIQKIGLQRHPHNFQTQASLPIAMVFLYKQMFWFVCVCVCV